MDYDDKAPLKDNSGVPSNEPVDYEAIFRREDSQSKKIEFAQETIVGECRNPRRMSKVEWLFMVVASASLLAVLAVTIQRLVYFEANFFNLTIYNNSMEVDAPCNTWLCTNDTLYAVVVLVNIGFCIFYCFDGLFRERPFEILAYVAGTTVIIVYIIINFIVNGWEGQVLRIVRLVFVCVLGPVNIFLALCSWWKMGYLVLNVIGSNKNLIRAYRIRSFFQTMQLFHLELLSSVLVLAWAQEGALLYQWEKVILPILLAYTFFVSIVGAITILWESKLLSFIWYFLISPCGVYYIYKVIQISVNFTGEYSTEFEEYRRDFDYSVVVDTKYIAVVLLLACVFGIAVVAVLIIFMTLSLLNFRKGLKAKIHPPFYKQCVKVCTCLHYGDHQCVN